jgi:hypothetical protein
MEEAAQHDNRVTLRKQVVEQVLNFLGIDEWVTYHAVVRNTMFVMFLAGIAIFHISNTHSAERMMRRISTLERDIRELRWEYLTIKSDLMLQSKQSELAKRLEPFGIKELREPPKKIVIEKGRY